MWPWRVRTPTQNLLSWLCGWCGSCWQQFVSDLEAEVQKFSFMNNPQLPNLQQTVANTILIINISNSYNINKFWVGIFTRQGHINKVNLTGESWLVSDNDSQWSDSGPIKRMKWKNVWKKFATYLWAFTSLVWLPPSILTVNVTPWSKKSCPQGTSWKKMKTLILCTFETYFWTIRRKRRRKISWKASVEFQFCDIQDWD